MSNGEKKYGQQLTDVTPGAVDVKSIETAFQSSWQKGIVPLWQIVKKKGSKWFQSKTNPSVSTSKESEAAGISGQKTPLGAESLYKQGGKASYNNIYEQNN